ncbi:hypothetical protein NHQ30_007891 [Ciborinia camelliae]|nr:hypothetical protein NHQ30_007891 [Ciborinia camelliae]
MARLAQERIALERSPPINTEAQVIMGLAREHFPFPEKKNRVWKKKKEEMKREREKGQKVKEMVKKMKKTKDKMEKMDEKKKQGQAKRTWEAWKKRESKRCNVEEKLK